MKVLVGAFNQEKALVGAFSVIVKIGCGTDGALHSTRYLSVRVGSVSTKPPVTLAGVAQLCQEPGASGWLLPAGAGQGLSHAHRRLVEGPLQR